MSVIYTPTPITSGYNISKINDNFTSIADALEDALSRSGGSPNEMDADIDLNGNDLLNVGVTNTTSLIVDGTQFVPSGVTAVGPPGPDGWSPVFGLFTSGGNAYFQLADYVGGTGTKPTTYIGYYVGPTGMVANAGDAVNVKGPAGAGSGDMLKATYDPASISQQLVGLTATQTLTNKSLTSPALTGTPTAPTASLNTNSTQIATTAYVDRAIKQYSNQTIYSSATTLALTDIGTIVFFTNASAMNYTIPLNATVAVPAFTRIDYIVYGAGQVTFLPVSGVTIHSKANATKTNGLYSACSLIYNGSDLWTLVGDITT